MNKSLRFISIAILSIIMTGLFMPVVSANFELQPVELQPIFIEEPLEPFQPLEPSPGDIYFEPFEIYDPYEDDPGIEIELWGETYDDGKVRLEWDRYEGDEFLYYKIMASIDKSDMVYPIDIELDYFENQNITTFIDEFPPLGTNFYRVCVITNDDRRGCTNPIELWVEIDPFNEEFEDDPFFPEDRNDFEDRPEFEDRPDFEDKPNLEDKEVDLPNKNQNIKEKNDRLISRLTRWLWANLGVVLAVLALLVAASGFTFATRNKRKSISKYMNDIDNTYTEYKMKAKRCEAELYRLRDIIDEQLKNGKIDDSAYNLLLGRIEGYMVDIQKQIVNEKFGGLPATLKDEMFRMMEDGEIDEGEMQAMQKLIKRSELSANEQDSLLDTIKDFKRQDELMKKKGRKS